MSRIKSASNPLQFLRLARRFYLAGGHVAAGNARERLAAAFHAAWEAAPEQLRSLAWKAYGGCGPREAPRARWSWQFARRADQRRRALAEPAGTWGRAFHIKLARLWWFEGDARDRDPLPFALP